MIRLRQIRILVDEDSIEVVINKCAKKLKVNVNAISNCRIIKKSIDARKKDEICYIYTVDVEVADEDGILKRCHNKDVLKSDYREYKIPKFGKRQLQHRPVIVGSGPSGLFCAYMLASCGYCPIIIERGKMVEERVKDVSDFWNFGNLEINSNVQFGEGGAGTFSDGKLNTLIKDSGQRIQKVLEIFVLNGAKEEILYENKPHIGTDMLRVIIKNMREKIIAMGGEFRFNTLMTNINIVNDEVVSIIVNNREEIPVDVLVLAIGHSARDTFRLLYAKGFNMESKPFAIGVRVQHQQEMINFSQYGVIRNERLKNASYKLTHRARNGRGVYTFCMCPGGYVVNASSELRRLAINGMSNYNRDSGNANSAIVVTVDKDDYGTGVLDGMLWQEKLEEKCYFACDGKIPTSLMKDYFSDRVSLDYGKVVPVFKGNYEFYNINKLLPRAVNEAIKDGICAFDKKINGYKMDDAIVSVIESRTSSPIRIIRDDLGESNYKGVYPIGEGCGYAGGITSSAVDGLVAFEKIVSLYKGIN